MASPNLRRIIRARGRLIINPTNLSIAYPYGGTEIGLHRDIEIEFNERYHSPTAEEWGGVPVETIYCGGSCILKAFVRGTDPTAIKNMWPFTSAGALTGDTVWGFNPSGASTNRAGTLLSTIFNNLSLMFAPLAAAQHPFVLIYRAFPMIEEAARMPMSLVEELSIPVAYQAIPDSQGRMFSVGRLGDISL